jgi:hypothetical protein
MDNLGIALVVVAAVLVIAAVAWWYSQRRRSERLQEQFGPEYDRAIDSTGDRRRAEAELTERKKRIEGFDIHPLTPPERASFTDEWTTVQAHFVDDPRAAIAEADRLVGRAMRARGYPVGDFEQRAADISVDHPAVVENYRGARGIAERSDRGDASTEDLRQAMVHYRSLFADLLGEPDVEHKEVRDDRAA